MIHFGGINRAALSVLPSLLDRWLPGGRREGTEYIARDPRPAGSPARTVAATTDERVALMKTVIECLCRFDAYVKRATKNRTGPGLNTAQFTLVGGAMLLALNSRTEKERPAGMVPATGRRDYQM